MSMGANTIAFARWPTGPVAFKCAGWWRARQANKPMAAPGRTTSPSMKSSQVGVHQNRASAISVMPTATRAAVPAGPMEW